MFIWLSILCSPPKDPQTSKYNEPSKTLRHHCTRGRQKQPPPMRKPKFTHSQRDLRARVKCAKAVMMKAKYEYCMAIQEARVERCAELEESEAIYSEALIAEHGWVISPMHHALPGTHRAHVGIGSVHALRVENKGCCDFLIVHQAVLHQAPQVLKDDLHSSYSLLLGPSSSSHQSVTLTPASQPGGQPLSIIPLKSGAWIVSSTKETTLIHWGTRGHINGWRFPPQPHRRDRQTPKEREDHWLAHKHEVRPCRCILARTQIALKRQEPVTSQLTPGIRPMVTQGICPMYSKN